MPLRGLWFNHHHHHHHHHRHRRSSSLEDGHREQNVANALQVLQNHDHDNHHHDHHHDHHKVDTVSKTLLFSFFIMGPAAFIFGTTLGWASSVTMLHVSSAFAMFCYQLHFLRWNITFIHLTCLWNSIELSFLPALKLLIHTITVFYVDLNCDLKAGEGSAQFCQIVNPMFQLYSMPIFLFETPLIWASFLLINKLS